MSVTNLSMNETKKVLKILSGMGIDRLGPRSKKIVSQLRTGQIFADVGAVRALRICIDFNLTCMGKSQAPARIHLNESSVIDEDELIASPTEALLRTESLYNAYSLSRRKGGGTSATTTYPKDDCAVSKPQSSPARVSSLPTVSSH
jgi:hypothetical protein